MNNNQQEKKEFDLFDTIWEEVVEKSIEANKKHAVVGCFSSRAKKIARSCFYNEAQTFVYSYMVDSTRNIDRHKIAACMLKAILVAKPYRVSFFHKVKQVMKKNDISDFEYLMNQYISIDVAINILQAYITSDKDKDIKHRIHFPEPFPEDPKDYIKDVCLDLYYTKPKRINTITYANIFFLWEKYSCRKVQGDNLENELRKYLKEQKSDTEVEQELCDIRMRSEIIYKSCSNKDN